MTTNKLPISVTMIALNEASRIESAIRSVLSFASEVIVVDSGSKDQTAVIAEKLGARVFQNEFQGYGQQKNFAQAQAKFEWVLNLDADECVTPALENEIRKFFASSEAQSVNGVYLPRKTWYLNRWIMHGGWYPNYLLRLARKEQSRWSEPALHEALQVKGSTLRFSEPFEHYSFPNQSSHILKNIRYTELQSRQMHSRGKQASVFDLVLRPIYKFVDGYIFKAGFLDGMAGFFIAVHSAYAVFLKYANLYEGWNGKSTKNFDR